MQSYLSALLLATTVIQSLPLLVDTTLILDSSSASGASQSPSSSSSAAAAAAAIFQSEPPSSSLEYYGVTDVTSSGKNAMDADEEGAIVMYKHPKAQFYPRPQGGYGGFRPNPPPLGYSYVGYINRQARRYPVMMYTLVQCVPCQRAKHLLATTYGDIPSHFLELVGSNDWQRQLQVDLIKVTRQDTFPYVFVCGQFIGGSSDLFNMHHSGQLRQVLNNCMSRNG